MTTKKQNERVHSLLPDGMPRYVRCYDDKDAFDRYTVVFTGRYKGRVCCDYVGMSEFPFHPQGFGQHGSAEHIIDANKSGFAPMIGKKNHIGTRINFSDLPKDCQTLVIAEYKAIWDL
jgi:hypothetical protein